MARSSRRGRGFTLIEILVAMVLLSLLAGAAAPFALSQIQGQRLRLTQERMRRVIDGMLGDPARGGHGYLGDLGELPPTLADMNQRGAKPLYTVDPNDGIGAGYNGPYVPQVGAAGVPFMDAWGIAFAYTPGTAQLASAGPDGQFATADDLVYPDAPPVAAGNLSVSVTGVPNDGGVACLLGDDDADVFVASSASGTRGEGQIAGPSGSGGPFTVAGLHRGFHGVRVAGQGGFAGASARDTIEVLGSTTALRVTLVQPAGAAAACGASGGGTPGGGGASPGGGSVADLGGEGDPIVIRATSEPPVSLDRDDAG